MHEQQHKFFLRRSVIDKVYKSTLCSYCTEVKEKAHEVWNIGVSMLFGKNCAGQ